MTLGEGKLQPAALLTHWLYLNGGARVWRYRNGLVNNNCRSGRRRVWRDVHRQIGRGFLPDRVVPIRRGRGSIRDAGLELHPGGVPRNDGNSHWDCSWTGLRTCGRRTLSARSDGRRRVSRPAKAPPRGRALRTPRSASCGSHRVRRCTKTPRCSTGAAISRVQRSGGLTHAPEAIRGRRGVGAGTHTLRKSP